MTKLIFALDVPDRTTALRYVEMLQGSVDLFKIGLQLFLREGPSLVEEIGATAPVFLDLKLHDIPATVGRAIRSLDGLPVELLTVHASGGRAMLAEAMEAARAISPSPRVLGVTVLTSLDAPDLEEIGCRGDPRTLVEARIRLLADVGVDGAVTSPLELEAIRSMVNESFLLVTPGIRPAADHAGDQKRVATPGYAASMGASHIVVGRPIRDAADPVAAAMAIREELHGAVR